MHEENAVQQHSIVFANLTASEVAEWRKQQQEHGQQHEQQHTLLEKQQKEILNGEERLLEEQARLALRVSRLDEHHRGTTQSRNSSAAHRSVRGSHCFLQCVSSMPKDDYIQALSLAGRVPVLDGNRQGVVSVASVEPTVVLAPGVDLNLLGGNRPMCL